MRWKGAVFFVFSFFCDCYAFSNHVKWVCIYFVIGCYISGADSLLRLDLYRSSSDFWHVGRFCKSQHVLTANYKRYIMKDIDFVFSMYFNVDTIPLVKLFVFIFLYEGSKYKSMKVTFDGGDWTKIFFFFFFFFKKSYFLWENILKTRILGINSSWLDMIWIQYTVKPVHAVSSMKQSHVLKGRLFLSCRRQFHMN